MIRVIDGKKGAIFHIDTAATSYIFRVDEAGQACNLYYGKRVAVQKDYSAVLPHPGKGFTNTVAYASDSEYSLDLQELEYSGTGKGDMRTPPIQIIMPDGSYVTDFVYSSHKIYGGAAKPDGMPAPDGECETLELTLADKRGVLLILYYTVFDRANVIARRVRLVNNSIASVVLDKIMSVQLDFARSAFEMISFDGASIEERVKNVRTLSRGICVTESRIGWSGNRSNPLVILREKNGECYGFNLIYSGNHYECAEVNAYGRTRFIGGINPHCFRFRIASGEYFDTPYAVMSYGADDNALSQNFHCFVNNNIVRGAFRGKERPVLVNNWEATYFDFNEPKLMKLAKTASKLGAELFVLDDGWFGKRDDDTSSLGDWIPNERKIGGLKALSEKINKLGMKFGLWFEPEMVNPDSKLFKTHPDFAVRLPSGEACLARNQYVLDLTRADVRDYIVSAVCTVLQSANIEYVKWDMNRNISDMFSPELAGQGEFYHRLILGLYDVLERITSAFPDILFESCASGGNRFDLGMLCFMPQIWTSDNTDPSVRIAIQGGTSYGYPQSVMGAHVSAAPHHQTLRNTPLLSRFNVAAFGLLGYELDLNDLSNAEQKEVASQIEFYKKYRALFQYGEFLRLCEGNRTIWQVTAPDCKTAAVLEFQTLTTPNPPVDVVKPRNLDSNALYKVSAVEQRMSIRPFGKLINHALPVPIKTDGLIYNTIDNNLMLKIEEYSVSATGDLLMNAGFRLKQQFNGSGYDGNVRVLTDFGSRLYIIEADN